MIIRMLSTQIPDVWDVIKFSLQQVEKIGADEGEAKFNMLFASLMCDKSQCFIKYDDESREILAIMITEVLEDTVTLIRTLKLRLLYAFKPFSMEEWSVNYELLRGFALSDKCSKIIFESVHPKIKAMATSVGFTERFVTMEIQL